MISEKTQNRLVVLSSRKTSKNGAQIIWSLKKFYTQLTAPSTSTEDYLSMSSPWAESWNTKSKEENKITFYSLELFLTQQKLSHTKASNFKVVFQTDIWVVGNIIYCRPKKNYFIHKIL